MAEWDKKTRISILKTVLVKLENFMKDNASGGCF